MKNILMFLDNFDTGGVTNVVRGIYRHLNPENYCIDFVRRNGEKTDFDEEVSSRGNKIYYYTDCGLGKIPVWNYKHRQLFIARQVIRQIRDSGKRYDVIHIHANPIIGLYIGVKLRIPVRIMHTHEAIPDFGENINRSRISAMIWKNRQRCYNNWATVKAGDSKKACCVKFGSAVQNDPKMVVLHPPIDMQRFSPASYDDQQLQTYNVDPDAFNMIHVGRLNPVKNQKFMIDVLAQISRTKKACLYMVGDGTLKGELEQYTREKGVNVQFLPGNTTPGLYKRMNCSLLPSFSEAFGMVAVESQLMGVPCFASTNVPEDVDIGMCEFLNLKDGAEKWAEAILSYDYKNASVDEKKKVMFDVMQQMETLCAIYEGKH